MQAQIWKTAVHVGLELKSNDTFFLPKGVPQLKMFTSFYISPFADQKDAWRVSFSDWPGVSEIHWSGVLLVHSFRAFKKQY